MPKIKEIKPGSLAEELDLQPGDELLSINGTSIQDVVDLQFALADEQIELEVRRMDGEVWQIEVDKDYDEGLGVEWEHPTVDKIHLCHNKCVFCFVDQIPGQMRKTLNVRDDDYRLSFLHGNFVTLTNLKQTELDRIIRLRMSPLNISVHATNPQVRIRMVGNKRAGEILEQIEYLAAGGIEMNTQVVLCPEWNDGQELDRTIEELAQFYPAVKTLSIVPVGLTKHRKRLHKMRGCTPNEARTVVDQVEKWQRKLRPELQASFVHAADEFYVLANKQVPAGEYYDDFSQTENGVGVIRTFLEELDEARHSAPKAPIQRGRKVGVVTSVSAANTIRSSVASIVSRQELYCEVLPVVNDFYGNNVSVAGLLTGTDIVNQLSGKVAHLDTLLLPDIMLKDDDDLCLDDYRVEEIERKLKVRVEVVPATGVGLVYGTLGYTQALPPRRRYEATLRTVAQAQ